MNIETLHAHVERSAADCDGRYDSSYVKPIVQGQTEYEFRREVIDVVVSVYSEHGDLKVRGDHYEYVETTDEGYEAYTAQLCDDEDCDDSERTYRDHTAESMGY